MASRFSAERPSRPNGLVGRPVQAAPGQALDHDREGVGGRGQVDQAVLGRAPLLVQFVEDVLELLERLGVGVVAGDIPEAAAGEGVPDVPGLLPATTHLLHCGLHVLAELGVVHLRAGHAHHREARRQEPAQGEVLHRRHELAAGQVTRGAEHHQDGRRRHPLDGGLGQRVVAHRPDPVIDGMLGGVARRPRRRLNWPRSARRPCPAAWPSARRRTWRRRRHLPPPACG
jgi:hypothetical protein